jgi:hypothetical protein
MRALLGLGLAFVLASASLAQDARISPLSQGAPAAEITYLKTPIEFYCKNSPAERETPDRRDQATGRGYAQVRNPSPFFNSEILNIEFDAASAHCAPDCRAALAQAIVKSLALWRSGCGRCQAEKLVAVAVDGGVWIDSVTVDKWLHALASRAGTAAEDPKKASRMSLRPFGRQPVVDFRRVNARSDQDLCRAASQYAQSADLKKAVCAGSVSRCTGPGCLAMPVRVGHAKRCELLGRIACGAPDGEIALNVTGYAYAYTLEAAAGPRRVTFGSGPHALDLFAVLLHETGHWFGLAHEQEADSLTLASIMRREYEGNRPWCVTSWNLTQIDNAIDQNWDYRLASPHGLVFKSQ